MRRLKSAPKQIKAAQFRMQLFRLSSGVRVVPHFFANWCNTALISRGMHSFWLMFYCAGWPRALGANSSTCSFGGEFAFLHRGLKTANANHSKRASLSILKKWAKISGQAGGRKNRVARVVRRRRASLPAVQHARCRSGEATGLEKRGLAARRRRRSKRTTP